VTTVTLEFAKEAEEANALEAKARSFGWRALALAFDEMTEQWVEALVSGAVIAALSEVQRSLGSDKVRFARGLAVMKKFVTQQQDRDPHEILRDLKVEYARLFVGPGAVPAPPCESAYRNRSPSCDISAAQGLWAASVEADYRRRGLSLFPCHRDLPDHVSTELVFMYFLSRQEGEAWEEGQIETAKELRRAQLGFLKEHLGGWLPEFCWRVQNATRSNLYWALAHILREFLVAETGATNAQSAARSISGGCDTSRVDTMREASKDALARSLCDDRAGTMRIGRHLEPDGGCFQVPGLAESGNGN
jgi:TorA maturation chaperone TorD